MPKRKLNYRFHDPNTTATTAEYIARLFVEVNTGKVEAAIQETAQANPGVGKPQNYCEERSA